MTLYKALYDYAARSDKELSLTKDEVIVVLKQDESGWAEGRSELRNAQGWFPISFVGIVETPKSQMDQLKAKKDQKKGKRMSTRFFSGNKKERPSLSSSQDTSAAASAAPECDDDGDDSILNNKKKTSNYLSKWISQRNTKLKEKGLLSEDKANYVPPGSFAGKKSNSIFGIDLTKVLQDYGGPIPPIVEQCAEKLRATSLQEEGLFRLSGIASHIDKLGADFFKVGAKPDLSIDCNAVAGALKKFFRELPEPVFTFAAHNNFLEATRQPDVCNALKGVLATLPRENYVIIYYLMQFLSEVAQYSEQNKMASNNIGIVFGPTLMRNEEETLSGMMNPLNNPAATISALVTNFSAIFDERPSELDSKAAPSPKTNTVSAPVRPSRSQTGSSASHNKVAPPPPVKARSGTELTPPSAVSARAPNNLANILRSNSGSIIKNEQKPPIAPKPAIAPKPSNLAPAPAAAEAPPAIPPKPVIPPKPTISTPEQVPSVPAKPALPAKPTVAEQKEYALALYDYAGDASLGQMDFSAGDKIEILKKHQSGWWTGDLNGVQGLFPMNFVEVIIE